MAAYFIDLDGTVFHFHTCDWLPGMKARLERLFAEGHQIIFISMRDSFRDAGTPYSVQATLDALATLHILHAPCFLQNIQSPRILVDDTAPTAVEVTTNDPTNSSMF
jgi:hypothetical protein